MKICKKIIIKIILAIILIYVLTPNALAAAVSQGTDLGGGSAGGGGATVGDVTGGAKDFLDTGKGQDSPINEDGLKQGSNTLYNVLLIIGVGVAMIWGTILGIQFVTGSLEEKANIKNGLTAYIFGCVVIFGAFGIWKLVISLLEGFE